MTRRVKLVSIVAAIWGSFLFPGGVMRAESGFGGNDPVSEIYFQQADTAAVSVTVRHSEKCLDVASVSQEEGAPVHQFECLGPDQLNQRWRFLPRARGEETWFQVRVEHTGQCLTVADGSMDPGANVVQQPCHPDFDHQLWRFEPEQTEEDPWSPLVVRHSGQCLDVFGKFTQNEAPVIQFPCHGEDNQLWQSFDRAANLRPFQPEGWESSFVISTETGDPGVASPLEPGKPLLIDFALTNDGPVASGESSVFFQLGNELLGMILPPLEPGAVFTFVDLQMSSPGVGAYELVATIDANAQVIEEVEGDNRLVRQIEVGRNPLYFPQFGAGSGLTSDFVLTNRSPRTTAVGRILLYSPEGDPVPLDPMSGGDGIRIEILGEGEHVSQQVETAGEFQIPPQATLTLSLEGPEEGVVTGSAVVVSSTLLSGVVRFSLPGFGVAGVPSAPPRESWVLPVRKAGKINTGLAVRNVGPSRTGVNFHLTDLQGDTVAVARRELEPGARISEFFTDLFPIRDDIEFRGTASFVPDSGAVVAVAVELGEGSGFTTLPGDQVDAALFHLDPIDVNQPGHIDMLQVILSRVDEDAFEFSIRTRGDLLEEGNERLAGLCYRLFCDFEEPFTAGFPSGDTDREWSVCGSDDFTYGRWNIDVATLSFDEKAISWRIPDTDFAAASKVGCVADVVDFQVEGPVPFDQMGLRIVDLSK